jgi:hypothetical protein
VRKSTDIAAEGECPSCGIIYAKFRPAGAGPHRASTASRPTSSASSATATPYKIAERYKTKMPTWIIPALLGLILGYFVGREHIKYEIRQTFQAAAEGVKRSVGAALSGSIMSSEPDKKEAPSPKLKEPAPFSIALNKKSFQAADYRAGIQAAITFALTFDNLTSKDIRAFEGVLTFTDLLDNTILSAKLAINDPVSSGSQLNWSGQLDYNQFMDKHQRLKNQEFQNLKIRFDTKKILFSDSSIKEYE